MMVGSKPVLEKKQDMLYSELYALGINLVLNQKHEKGLQNNIFIG